MELPGIFEVFQLAIGPSMTLNTGAMRIGQAFRELLFSSPYRSNHRILIELSGTFSREGREFRSDEAVVSGLGGYSPEDPSTNIHGFYSEIRENGCFSFFREIWPFNPESDVLFNQHSESKEAPDCIKFHLISSMGQTVYQAEYFPGVNGQIGGTGLSEQGTGRTLSSPHSLEEIKRIIIQEGLDIIDYMVMAECAIHKINNEQYDKRMLATWKLMMAHIDRGLKSKRATDGQKQGNTQAMYRNYLNRLASNPAAGADHTRCAIYASALSEEIMRNKPVITAPTCMGSAIVPAVLRNIQERFMLSDEKMAESLTVCGLFGSLALDRLNTNHKQPPLQTEVACSALMAAAGVSYLTGGTFIETERAASMAALFYSGSFDATLSGPPHPFTLYNPAIAQTLIPIVELSAVQPDNQVPGFDEALQRLFPNR